MTSETVVPEQDRLRGTDGVGIHVRRWRPAAPPRAAVVICHGVNSHGGQYQWVAEQLVAAGYAVTALDLRGRGQSDGERYFVADIADYVADLDLAVADARARHAGLPLFLLGHSAGGVVSCTWVLQHQHLLTGFICESFAFRVPAPAFALKAIQGLSRFAPRLGVLRLKNRDFSRDPAWVAQLDADPLTAREVQPAITVAALSRADEVLEGSFDRITVPVMILHGTADKATLPAGSRFFHQHAGSADKTLRLYEGHAHDLLADTGREAVMADIMAWMNARMPAT